MKEFTKAVMKLAAVIWGLTLILLMLAAAALIFCPQLLLAVLRYLAAAGCFWAAAAGIWSLIRLLACS